MGGHDPNGPLFLSKRMRGASLFSRFFNSSRDSCSVKGTQERGSGVFLRRENSGKKWSEKIIFFFLAGVFRSLDPFSSIFGLSFNTRRARDEAPPGPSGRSLAPRCDPCACCRRHPRGGERREAKGLWWRREERRRRKAICFGADDAATTIFDSSLKASAAATR